ncbi:bifunctional hydroxymethylpyrimidine kinase/phosphomethylpyrimidine kinase [Dyella sp. A6]|uniref:bifunctional hydroxymethylpyrimidine kinase/phosphomethylpyrimidine kinase n=1 Tax=Dyella aluminiiresistens TaxID=3069105 RepID=UPI002E779AB3|nr:bifunctional hydroxymethylpyrimidine kinase/phosphomethylpyrimidine kinase [Dyella sp. A6]
MIPHVLSVAGNDPTACSGIGADLKTFAALGAYGMAVITALTVQNTQGVRAISPVAPECVGAQLDAVLEDVRVDALKLGMLTDTGIICAVATRLASRPILPAVLDPVMLASSGDALMTGHALAALRDVLLPRITVLTPNLHEAATLLDIPPAGNLEQMHQQAVMLQGLGPSWVLLKGGHLGGECSPDVLAGPSGVQTFDAPRLACSNSRGTGCTLSSAIAALLPRHSVHESVAMAKRFVKAALSTSDTLDVGEGPGPLNHFCSNLT